MSGDVGQVCPKRECSEAPSLRVGRAAQPQPEVRWRSDLMPEAPTRTRARARKRHRPLKPWLPRRTAARERQARLRSSGGTGRSAGCPPPSSAPPPRRPRAGTGPPTSRAPLRGRRPMGPRAQDAATGRRRTPPLVTTAAPSDNECLLLSRSRTQGSMSRGSAVSKDLALTSEPCEGLYFAALPNDKYGPGHRRGRRGPRNCRECSGHFGFHLFSRSYAQAAKSLQHAWGNVGGYPYIPRKSTGNFWGGRQTHPEPSAS